MNELGKAIRKERRRRGWNVQRLAEEIQKLPGAPEVSEDQIARLEGNRATVKLDPDEEPLSWVMRALDIPDKVLLAAVGL